MKRERRYCARWLGRRGLFILLLVLLSGCDREPTSINLQPGSGTQKAFELKEITAEQGQAFLSRLGLNAVSALPGRNALAVTGSASDLYRSGVVLGLVDTREEFVIEPLGPASESRAMPTNSEIAEALGNVAIGTFTDPPTNGEYTRAIIDIHGQSIMAILPARIRQELLACVHSWREGQSRIGGMSESSNGPEASTIESRQEEPNAAPQTVVEPTASQVSIAPMPQRSAEPDGPEPACEPSARLDPDSAVGEQKAPDATTLCSTEATRTPEPHARPLPGERDTIDRPIQESAKATTKISYELPPLPNADDIVYLDLPDRLEMIQLLDLAAEYLSLDYMYEPEKMRGQSVSLRLHGKLQGEIRVKDLYPLVESILKFKGFAMTSHKGNLVTIVPVDNALQVDPALLDSNDTSLNAGDMVVTRVFDLQYINSASAVSLLDSMKLSMAVSPITETRSLIVTCYAHRMDRIERLLAMVDRPGRPKEFRYRQLKYTMAGTLTKKVETLVAELQTIPVRIVPAEQKPSTPVLTVGVPPASASARPRTPAEPAGSQASDRQTVYLDADDRTNRILMIGHTEELAIVDEVIDALDVAQHDPRSLKVYPITHLGAVDAKKKLEELEVVGKTKERAGAAPAVFISKTASDKPVGGDAISLVAAEETQLTVLEATNSLLINATQEQHDRVAVVLSRVDVVEQDLRNFRTYEIRYVDAKEVKKQLEEFELIGKKSERADSPTSAPASPTVSASAGIDSEQPMTMQRPQVSVLESTNSLLVNATDFQHARMAAVIKHVDMAVRDEAIPYEIYFLENQEPEHLAEVFLKILRETALDKEAKAEETTRRTGEEIVIVPDKNTFSLIVYASKKNQEWISRLIKTLDRRRPQVLIDATLVEIRKSDEFNYDLDLVASIPNLLDTGGQISQFLADENTTVTDKLLQSDRSQFIDFEVNSGTGIGFYGDRHVQALLTAVQAKNYGRVLAKPKVLVNDNEKGVIKTADTTYAIRKSSVPIATGTAGPQNNLIETAVNYEPYDAGITLEITPHISEGELLRLEIALTRSDFTSTSDVKPPDQTSSDITTVVTVPDGSTIILGGMLKLNQSKGAEKVPILGDLPLVGGLFRRISNSDTQSKLYVFVRAEIIRPAEALAKSYEDLKRISEQNREAFERHELEFQRYQTWPGIKSEPLEPATVLDAH